MGFGSAFSGGGGGLGRVFGKNTGLLGGSALGMVGGMIGSSFDSQRDMLAAQREGQDAMEAALAKEAKRRAKGVKDVRATFGIGGSAKAKNMGATLGAKIGQNVGNAREQGLEELTQAGSEGMKQANIAAANTGTMGSSLGRKFAATATQGYGAGRQELASGLGGLRQGAVAALAQARTGLERSIASGAPMDNQLAASQQAGALRQYALGVPLQTANNMVGTLGATAVQSSLMNARGYDTPDVMGLTKLTSNLGKSTPGQQSTIGAPK